MNRASPARRAALHFALGTPAFRDQRGQLPHQRRPARPGLRLRPAPRSTDQRECSPTRLPASRVLASDRLLPTQVAGQVLAGLSAVRRVLCYGRASARGASPAAAFRTRTAPRHAIGVRRSWADGDEPAGHRPTPCRVRVQLHDAPRPGRSRCSATFTAFPVALVASRSTDWAPPPAPSPSAPCCGHTPTHLRGRIFAGFDMLWRVARLGVTPRRRARLPAAGESGRCISSAVSCWWPPPRSADGPESGRPSPAAG
ncbi:hypothetical protein HBB16_20840 [Pseudonocardia sp. MCCB 268]|nr:hypothetical protein [Pseudonocardia cytotoxica]